jgi:methionyl-tRNA synthetase
MAPFIPSVSEKLTTSFGVEEDLRWEWNGLPKTVKITEVIPLVKKVEVTEHE